MGTMQEGIIDIYVPFIVLALTALFTFISAYYAYKSRKYATQITNAVTLLRCVGEVIAAVHGGRGCLWDIQHTSRIKNSERWLDAMQNKRVQASILIAKAGLCKHLANDVLSLGEALFKLDNNLDTSFDEDGHAEFFITSDRILDDLKKLQKILSDISEGELKVRIVQ